MLDRLKTPELHTKIVAALDVVEERLQHLQGFLTGLARLGQLPKPQKRDVVWSVFVDGLRTLWSDVAITESAVPPGWFDPAQIQQVLINLVKNAHEAGGPRDGVRVELEAAPEGGVLFTVLDRGSGMSEDVMSRALVPAFTTKERGSGMGLTLCREIVEAHDGRLRIWAPRGRGNTGFILAAVPQAGGVDQSRSFDPHGRSLISSSGFGAQAKQGQGERGAPARGLHIEGAGAHLGIASGQGRRVGAGRRLQHRQVRHQREKREPRDERRQPSQRRERRQSPAILGGAPSCSASNPCTVLSSSRRKFASTARS